MKKQICYSEEYHTEITDAIWELLDNFKPRFLSEAEAMLKLYEFLNIKESEWDIDLDNLDNYSLHLLYQNHSYKPADFELNYRMTSPEDLFTDGKW